MILPVRSTHLIAYKQAKGRAGHVQTEMHAGMFCCRYLVEHRMVDVMVCTAGGIEEDIIKCMGHTYVGDFNQFKGERAKHWWSQDAVWGGMNVPCSCWCSANPINSLKRLQLYTNSMSRCAAFSAEEVRYK